LEFVVARARSVAAATLCVGLLLVLYLVASPSGSKDDGGLEFVVEQKEAKEEAYVWAPDNDGMQVVAPGHLPLTAAEAAYLDISDRARLTVEYSFKVDPNLFTEDRDEGLDFYLDLLERTMSITGVDKETALVSTRCESAYRGLNDACDIEGGNVLIRVRNYIDGFRKNTQTVDMKESFRGYPTAKKAAQTRLMVSPHLNGEEKLERDQHVCNAKYSREGRVLDFEYNRALRTCREINDLFPYVSMGNPDAEMVPLSDGWLWWVWQISGGTVPIRRPDGTVTDMEFQLTLTLQYSGGCDQMARSLSANTKKRPSQKSEFSVRFFATNHGHGPWDEAVQTVDQSYQALALELNRLGLLATQDLECE